MEQLVITLQTADRDPAKPDDDGQRRVFAKGGMLKAIRAAVKAKSPTGKLELRRHDRRPVRRPTARPRATSTRPGLRGRLRPTRGGGRRRRRLAHLSVASDLTPCPWCGTPGPATGHPACRPAAPRRAMGEMPAWKYGRGTAADYNYLTAWEAEPRRRPRRGVGHRGRPGRAGRRPSGSSPHAKPPSTSCAARPTPGPTSASAVLSSARSARSGGGSLGTGPWTAPPTKGWVA